MSDRLDNIPVYEYKKGQIEGHYYNQVQIALKRLGNQIRLNIPGLKHLDLVIDENAWIIIDKVHAEVPIAAWTDFDSGHRNSLNEAIPCTIKTYHQAADMILQRTLDSMEILIHEQLIKKYGDNGDKILLFPSQQKK